MTEANGNADVSAPNLEQLAHRIIITSVAVQPGEVVVIEGGAAGVADKMLTNCYNDGYKLAFCIWLVSLLVLQL
jgi:hypothetical protein